MIEINNTTRTKVDQRLIRSVAEQVLKLYRKASYDVSIAFVGEVTIRRLNRESRGYDKVTDILAFEGDGQDLGELILCNRQIARQAPRYDQTPRGELVFILVHGLLHLFGYRDDTEQGRLEMIKLGEKIITKIKK